jgi:hypothetical protein
MVHATSLTIAKLSVKTTWWKPMRKVLAFLCQAIKESKIEKLKE